MDAPATVFGVLMGMVFLAGAFSLGFLCYVILSVIAEGYKH